MDAFDDAFGGEGAADGSSGSPPPMTEVDPAAEFLAKEQEDLGGLGEDLGFTSAPQEVAASQNGDMMEEPVAVDNSEPAPVENLSHNFNGMRVREEPESIKKWKAEQEVRLREKDQNEEKNKEELKKQAKKELEDWYKRYEEQLQKTKDTNRNEEETVVAEVNSIKPGTEWERVAKQCDFSAKNTRNTKDVSRMRGLLLQLKQNPPTRE